MQMYRENTDKVPETNWESVAIVLRKPRKNTYRESNRELLGKKRESIMKVFEK